jgi:hypothetical protein
MDALVCPDLEATSGDLLPGVVRRWSVAVTGEEARAHLGCETQRQGSDQAIAPTTPVLWGRCARVTLLALQLSQHDPRPGSATAGYRNVQPTFTACLALVRQPLWRARYVVHSPPEAEPRPFPPAVVDLLIPGIPLAA